MATQGRPRRGVVEPRAPRQGESLDCGSELGRKDLAEQPSWNVLGDGSPKGGVSDDSAPEKPQTETMLDAGIGDRSGAPAASPLVQASHPARRLRVLFACTWNASRSPMAAALATEIAALAWKADSAGVHRGRPVDPLAVSAMAELGLDIAGHQPLSLHDIEAQGGDLGSYDLIVALSDAAEEEATEVARFSEVKVERWAVDDPTQYDGHEPERLAAYRRTRDALAVALQRRMRGVSA